MVYLEPGSPFENKPIPDEINIFRDVVRIDPQSWIPVEATQVDHRTPTPEGFVDLWVYRHALSTLRRDTEGRVIEPIPVAFDASRWQGIQIPQA